MCCRILGIIMPYVSNTDVNISDCNVQTKTFFVCLQGVIKCWHVLFMWQSLKFWLYDINDYWHGSFKCCHMAQKLHQDHAGNLNLNAAKVSLTLVLFVMTVQSIECRHFCVKLHLVMLVLSSMIHTVMASDNHWLPCYAHVTCEILFVASNRFWTWFFVITFSCTCDCMMQVVSMTAKCTDEYYFTCIIR